MAASCAGCGRALEADATFCHACGRRATFGEGSCEMCGQPLIAGAGFCGHCGAVVAPAASQRPQAQSTGTPSVATAGARQPGPLPSHSSPGASRRTKLLAIGGAVVLAVAIGVTVVVLATRGGEGGPTLASASTTSVSGIEAPVTAAGVDACDDLFMSLVLKPDGSLWAGGGGGELGEAHSPAPDPAATRIGSEFDWAAVSGDGYCALALKTRGSLWACPGTRATDSLIRIGSDSDWAAVSGGSSFLALKTDGSLWAGDSNADGSSWAGDSNGADGTLTRVGSDSDWAAVSTGGAGHSLALKTDGSLWAWGDNDRGQLGDGTQTDRLDPNHVGSDSDWVAVRAGVYYSMALKADGSLWAWGDNSDGQLGDGFDGTDTNRLVPTRVGSDSDWVALGPGYTHSLAIKKDGSLWAWGSNGNGELGDGTTTDSPTPIRIGSDSDWAAVSGGDSGREFSLAVKTDGSIWTWGEIGGGETTTTASPVPATIVSPAPATTSSVGDQSQGESLEIVLEADPAAGPVTSDAMDQAVKIIQSRLNGLGVAESRIQRQGERQIVVQLPGMKNAQQVIDVIGQTAVLEFFDVAQFGDPFNTAEAALTSVGAASKNALPKGDALIFWPKTEQGNGVADRYYLVTTPAPVTGAMIKAAQQAYDSRDAPKVDIEFTDSGTTAFAAVTKYMAETLQITGTSQRLAIVLDGKVESAPTVKQEIGGGQAEITGAFTLDEAKNLALVLQTGALPVDLVVVSQRSIPGP